MLAKQWRTPIRAPWGAIKKIRRARIEDAAAEFRMLDFGEKSARLELLVIEERLGVAHDRVGLAQQLRALQKLVAIVILDPFVEHVEQMLGVLPSIRDVVPHLIAEVLRLTVAVDPFQERGPVAQRAMHDVAVAAFADAEKSAPMQRAAA